MSMAKTEEQIADGRGKQRKIAQMVNVYKQWLETDNFLSAYIVSFSFMEQMVGSMHAARGLRKGTGKFAPSVDDLARLEDVDQATANRFKQEAKTRNELVHEAVWKFDAVTLEDAERAMKLARMASRARDKQKRKLADEQ